jgi:hypothetical protein
MEPNELASAPLKDPMTPIVNTVAFVPAPDVVVDEELDVLHAARSTTAQAQAAAARRTPPALPMLRKRKYMVVLHLWS